MRVLHVSTVVWGVLSIAVALALIRVGLVLDAWWQMAGTLSGGVLGLFLLGQVCRRADNVAGAIAVTIGALVILWMSLPSIVDVPPQLRNPFHANMTIVIGTLTIFLIGLIVAQLRGSAHRRDATLR
jgi:SSS family solute:Na+ symporter